MITARIIWAVLSVVPSIFPAYLLLIYRDPGGGNFGWEMFLGFYLFWGSILLAIVLTIANCAMFLRKPTLLVSRHVALCFTVVSLAPLVMGAVLLLQ